MIAISYRREDSTPIAGRLFDRLEAEFGRGNVFMDFDSIPYGVDFREHIQQSLSQARALVVIIGPHWCESPTGVRRIDDANDFVRLEVRCALQRAIPVIPVLVNNTIMPKAEDLPADIEGLAFRNALVLDTGIDFHHHTTRLISGVRTLVEAASDSTGDNRQSKTSAGESRKPNGGAAIKTPARDRKQRVVAPEQRRKIFVVAAITLVAVALLGATLLGGWRLVRKQEQHQTERTTLQALIEGRWLLRLANQPPDYPPQTYMRITLDGTRLKVIGDSWTGIGSFDGQEGYYDWEFHDGTAKTGSTKIKLDREGHLYGTVNGSGINWSYWASRQQE